MNNPSIIVNTNLQREAINKVIKSEIMSKPGTGEGHIQKIWRPVHLSKAQKTKVGSYEGASHIRFTRHVGNEIMHSILNYANRKNMPRVVLMGDPSQLPPIEAGRPLSFF